MGNAPGVMNVEDQTLPDLVTQGQLADFSELLGDTVVTTALVTTKGAVHAAAFDRGQASAGKLITDRGLKLTRSPGPSGVPTDTRQALLVPSPRPPEALRWHHGSPTTPGTAVRRGQRGAAAPFIGPFLALFLALFMTVMIVPTFFAISLPMLDPRS